MLLDFTSTALLSALLALRTNGICALVLVSRREEKDHAAFTLRDQGGSLVFSGMVSTGGLACISRSSKERGGVCQRYFNCCLLRLMIISYCYNGLLLVRSWGFVKGLFYQIVKAFLWAFYVNLSKNGGKWLLFICLFLCFESCSPTPIVGLRMGHNM